MRDLCDRLEDEGRKTYGEWTPTHVRQLMREAAAEISRLRDENARHHARQEPFLSELAALREEHAEGLCCVTRGTHCTPEDPCVCCAARSAARTLGWDERRARHDGRRTDQPSPSQAVEPGGLVERLAMAWAKESVPVRPSLLKAPSEEERQAARFFLFAIANEIAKMHSACARSEIAHHLRTEAAHD